MGRKSKWELERDKHNALRKKAMKSLTQDQLTAIKFTHDTLSNVLDMLVECNDLYLSDINKLSDAFWKLKNEFNMEDKKNG
tara:strand:+ start:361 stop:603 length:243 start_codon:yes stop_codon:yes gene_type:complete